MDKVFPSLICYFSKRQSVSHVEKKNKQKTHRGCSNNSTDIFYRVSYFLSKKFSAFCIVSKKKYVYKNEPFSIMSIRIRHGNVLQKKLKNASFFYLLFYFESSPIENANLFASQELCLTCLGHAA